MRNVAIIEDDISSQNDVKNFLLRYGKEKGEEFAVFTFTTAEQFLTGYKADYDLVLMDIDLPGMNGMNAAKKLREIDGDTVLVFITNMAQFAVGGYEVGAFDFILKPVTYANFYLKFARIMQKVRAEDSHYIAVRGKQFSKRISVSDLIYVEIADHDLVYHTVTGLVEGHGSMRVVSEQLKDDNFVLCNQSYLVNLKFVTEVSGGEVKVGGDTLVISRPKKKDFLKAVEQYFSGKHGQKSERKEKPTSGGSEK